MLIVCKARADSVAGSRITLSVASRALSKSDHRTLRQGSTLRTKRAIGRNRGSKCLSSVRDAPLRVGVEINADELPCWLPNHVRATGQRIGCKCPIAENERDREQDSQHDSRQHRFHRKNSSQCPAHFLRESMSKMRRWCCVIGHRGDLPRYTQGALFFAKVKIARSNVSRAAVSRLRLCDGHHQKYEFDAAVALSTTLRKPVD